MSVKRKPIVQPTAKVRGQVIIHEERCKGCGFCIEFCPKGVLVASPKFNSKGYHPPSAAKPEECVCCNLCFLVCPEFAIYSVPADRKEIRVVFAPTVPATLAKVNSNE
ncbi:MAG: 4Fe-4S binding protein [Armatimonadetes bacterium]|nr:4Fe-4S binding protein [Armatimonadota bacterium]